MKNLYDGRDLSIEELKSLHQADQPIMKGHIPPEHRLKLLKRNLLIEVLDGPKTTDHGKYVLHVQGQKIGRN